MKTTLKRVLSILCFISSLSLVSFVDFDQTNSASSENWKNGTHVRQFNSDLAYYQHPSMQKMSNDDQNSVVNAFSWIKLEDNVLKISLLDQRPTSIQIFKLDGKTQWYEFFAQKTYAIRPNLSKGMYIARLYQGEKYNTMKFIVD